MLEKIQYYLSVADAAIKYKKAVYDQAEAKRKYHNVARRYMDTLPIADQQRGKLIANEGYISATADTYSDFIKKRSAANRAKHRLFKVIGYSL